MQSKTSTRSFERPGEASAKRRDSSSILSKVLAASISSSLFWEAGRLNGCSILLALGNAPCEAVEKLQESNFALGQFTYGYSSLHFHLSPRDFLSHSPSLHFVLTCQHLMPYISLSDGIFLEILSISVHVSCMIVIMLYTVNFRFSKKLSAL